MLGHGGSSAGSYLTNPTSPIPSHCAVIILFQSVSVVTSTVRVKHKNHGLDSSQVIKTFVKFYTTGNQCKL